MGTLVVVDYMSMYFRNFYVNPDMFSIHEGNRYLTGGIFGCVNSISRLKRMYPGSPLIVCTEPESNDNRFSLNASYKANRSKKDPAMLKLTNETKRLLSLVKDVFLFSSENSGEADDCIATVITNNRAKFDKFIVASFDNDLLQISAHPDLKGKVFYAPKKDEAEIPFESYCQEKYEMSPDKILLYRSVKGDSSDNLPAASFRLQYKMVREWVSKVSNLAEFKNVLEENKSNKHAAAILENWKNVESNFSIMKLNMLKLVNVTNAEGKSVEYFKQKYSLGNLDNLELK